MTRGRVRGAVLVAALLGCARAGAPPPPRSPLPGRVHRAFQHPGLLTNADELAALRRRVAAERDPAFQAIKESRFAALDWRPAPRREVFCGPYSRPDRGCSEEKNDATAAYTHALLAAVTGSEPHARKAVEILDAWSGTLVEHTGHNAPLQSAWVASLFVRAAELVRHTSTAWTPEGVARFSRLLDTAYLPYVVAGMPTYNGNWELSMIEATMASGVFLDDGALFERAVAMWRKRVPAYFYLTADGARPVPPPGPQQYDQQALIGKWYGQSRFVDGLCQETCRDFGHTMYGVAAAVNAAEIAFHQGLDLYAEEARRLTATLEFHAAYLLGEPAPPWLCGGRLNLRRSPTGEIAYHHFHDRRGLALPLTGRLIQERIRPSGTDHHMAWESFTHAGLDHFTTSQ